MRTVVFASLLAVCLIQNISGNSELQESESSCDTTKTTLTLLSSYSVRCSAALFAEWSKAVSRSAPTPAAECSVELVKTKMKLTSLLADMAKYSANCYDQSDEENACPKEPAEKKRRQKRNASESDEEELSDWLLELISPCVNKGALKALLKNDSESAVTPEEKLRLLLLVRKNCRISFGRGVRGGFSSTSQPLAVARHEHTSRTTDEDDESGESDEAADSSQQTEANQVRGTWSFDKEVRDSCHNAERLLAETYQRYRKNLFKSAAAMADFMNSACRPTSSHRSIKAGRLTILFTQADEPIVDDDYSAVLTSRQLIRRFRRRCTNYHVLRHHLQIMVARRGEQGRRQLAEQLNQRCMRRQRPPAGQRRPLFRAEEMPAGVDCQRMNRLMLDAECAERECRWASVNRCRRCLGDSSLQYDYAKTEQRLMRLQKSCGN